MRYLSLVALLLGIVAIAPTVTLADDAREYHYESINVHINVLSNGDMEIAETQTFAYTSGDYSSPIYDSGTDMANKTSLTVPSGYLHYNTTYYWFSSEFGYRRLIPIAGAAGAGFGYQVKIEVDSGVGDDGEGVVYLNHHCRDFPNDIRFTDSDSAVELDHWLESATGDTAVFWVKVNDSLSSDLAIYIYYGSRELGHRICADHTSHEDYGLAYPVTYKFSIPENSGNLRAFHRHKVSEDWSELAEKTSQDFFNGVECVRFDYEGNHAYISVAFADGSDFIYLKVTDAGRQRVETTYIETCQYYDNRKAVAVITADDWSNATHPFNLFCDMCRDRGVWLTVGVNHELQWSASMD